VKFIRVEPNAGVVPSLRRVEGRRRRPPTVLGVDSRAHLLERLPGPAHCDHVTRDVQTDRSGRRMAREGNRAVAVERLHIAVLVVLMAEPVATAEARDVPELVAMLDGVPVKLPGARRARSREVGELPFRNRLHLVAYCVGRDRPGERSPGHQQDTAGRRAIQEPSPSHCVRPPLIWWRDNPPRPSPAVTTPRLIELLDAARRTTYKHVTL